MKNFFPKSFAAVIVFSAIFQMPLFAQVKTTFTKEVRPSGSNPTGLASAEHISQRNKTDVALPRKPRSIDRFKKLNVWGKVVPDSFLFYRSSLNQKQQLVYDAIYKALMKNEDGATLPVGLSVDEFRDTMYSVCYDSPEAFWWGGGYSYWTNSDDTVTKFEFRSWMDKSDFDNKYEEFKNATNPILFYAATLPDDMSKIKYIHDYICLSTEYDYDSYNAGNTGGKLQTAYSGAVEYKTVCAGYTTLFEYYMQNLGIPCTYVSSNGHAWNMLKVNNQYYQMDVTWNDTNEIPPYYNLTHEEMNKIESHTPEPLAKKVIDSNPSTGNDMSYLNYYGALLEGSPYTYKELMYYNYAKSIFQTGSVKIYKNEPEVLSIVRNGDELKTAIQKTYGSVYPEGSVFKFFVPSREEMDLIYDRLYDGDLSDYYLKGQRSYVGNGVIYDLTLDTKTINKNLSKLINQTNVVETQTSVDEVSPGEEKKQSAKVAPKIGDKGPAGGIIFYIEGNKSFECSEILGKEKLDDAKALCKNYRGGGKDDWYLPTKTELDYIYQNLRKTGILTDDNWYWSSSFIGREGNWVQCFGSGDRAPSIYRNEQTNAVRAVRGFEF